MAKKNDFIKQLTQLKNVFLTFVKEKAFKVNMNSFEVEMCKYYLQFRIEAENKYGDTLVFTQEIETDSTSDIYQKPIYGNYIHIEE